jgi:hypothetical protein
MQIATFKPMRPDTPDDWRSNRQLWLNKAGPRRIERAYIGERHRHFIACVSIRESTVPE